MPHIYGTQHPTMETKMKTCRDCGETMEGEECGNCALAHAMDGLTPAEAARRLAAHDALVEALREARRCIDALLIKQPLEVSIKWDATDEMIGAALTKAGVQ